MHLPRISSALLAASLLAASTGCYCGPCGPQSCLPNFFPCATQHACDSGCGEVYIDEWLNEPPHPDPCDSCGNYNGQSCGTCRPLLAGLPTLWGYRYQGGGCDSHGPACGCDGGFHEPGCGLPPACGCDGGFHEPGCGFEPSCGCEPGFHEPGCGFEPSCGHEPGCGFEHGACGCGAGAVHTMPGMGFDGHSVIDGEVIDGEVIESERGPEEIAPRRDATSATPSRTRRIYQPRESTPTAARPRTTTRR